MIVVIRVPTEQDAESQANEMFCEALDYEKATDDYGPSEVKDEF